jgi:hypothetical protein
MKCYLLESFHLIFVFQMTVSWFLRHLNTLDTVKGLQNIVNFTRACNTAYCNCEKIFIQNLRATISDIYDVL